MDKPKILFCAFVLALLVINLVSYGSSNKKRRRFRRAFPVGRMLTKEDIKNAEDFEDISYTGTEVSHAVQLYRDEADDGFYNQHRNFEGDLPTEEQVCMAVWSRNRRF